MASMSNPILVVEDDPDTALIVRTYLEREGYTVNAARDGLSGLKRALDAPPSLIVLDWMLPGMNGLEFLKRLRIEQNTPVIMLTARGEGTERVLGLELGADDYVPKPFDPHELVARVKAVLRRTEGGRKHVPEAVDAGPLRLDPVRRLAWMNGGVLELTVLEFDLLYTLAAHPGRVFSRDELLDRVWGSDYVRVDRVVDVHLSNLRQKLEPDPQRPTYLLTVRGIGYKFADKRVPRGSADV